MNWPKKILCISLSTALVWSSGNGFQCLAALSELPARPSDLPQIKLIPPSSLGHVVDYFNAAEKPGVKQKPLVVLIQDLHAHYGVQKNIAGLLEFLSGKLAVTSPLALSSSPTPPFALAVEGAAGPLDSSVMALFPNEFLKEKASQFLMREGELGGAEYFAVKHRQPHLVVGVENDQYYTVHRDLFRSTFDTRQTLVHSLEDIHTALLTLSRQVYSHNVKQFDAKERAYESGHLSIEEFIGFLVSAGQQAGINLKTNFPTLASFAINSRYGTGPAFTADGLHHATEQFLSQALEMLSPEEKRNLQILAKLSDHTPYYLYIRDIIYKHQLFLAAPTELAAYLEYLHVRETQGMDRIIYEARELAFQIKHQVAHAAQEKEVVQVLHDVELLKRVADLQATENEVRAFAPRLQQFIALTKALLETMPNPPDFDANAVHRLIASSIDYYVMAMMRNAPMVENTLALIEENHLKPQTEHVKPHKSNSSLKFEVRGLRSEVRDEQRVAVLVAGGFHTGPITKLLREKNISFVVLTPAVDKITAHDRELYLKRLNGHYLTSEDIMAGLHPASPSIMSLTHWIPSLGSHASLAYITPRQQLNNDFKTFIADESSNNTAENVRGSSRREAIVGILGGLVAAGKALAQNADEDYFTSINIGPRKITATTQDREQLTFDLSSGHLIMLITDKTDKEGRKKETHLLSERARTVLTKSLRYQAAQFGDSNNSVLIEVLRALEALPIGVPAKLPEAPTPPAPVVSQPPETVGVQNVTRVQELVDAILAPPPSNKGYQLYEVPQPFNHPIYVMRFNSMTNFMAHWGRIMARYDLEDSGKPLPYFDSFKKFFNELWLLMAKHSGLDPKQQDFESITIRGTQYTATQVAAFLNDWAVFAKSRKIPLEHEFEIQTLVSVMIDDLHLLKFDGSKFSVIQDGSIIAVPYRAQSTERDVVVYLKHELNHAIAAGYPPFDAAIKRFWNSLSKARQTQLRAKLAFYKTGVTTIFLREVWGYARDAVNSNVFGDFTGEERLDLQTNVRDLERSSLPFMNELANRALTRLTLGKSTDTGIRADERFELRFQFPSRAQTQGRPRLTQSDTWFAGAVRGRLLAQGRRMDWVLWRVGINRSSIEQSIGLNRSQWLREAAVRMRRNPSNDSFEAPLTEEELDQLAPYSITASQFNYAEWSSIPFEYSPDSWSEFFHLSIRATEFAEEHFGKPVEEARRNQRIVVATVLGIGVLAVTASLLLHIVLIPASVFAVAVTAILIAKRLSAHHHFNYHAAGSGHFLTGPPNENESSDEEAIARRTHVSGLYDYLVLQEFMAARNFAYEFLNALTTAPKGAEITRDHLKMAVDLSKSHYEDLDLHPFRNAVILLHENNITDPVEVAKQMEEARKEYTIEVGKRVASRWNKSLQELDSFDKNLALNPTQAQQMILEFFDGPETPNLSKALETELIKPQELVQAVQTQRIAVLAERFFPAQSGTVSTGSIPDQKKFAEAVEAGQWEQAKTTVTGKQLAKALQKPPTLGITPDQSFDFMRLLAKRIRVLIETIEVDQRSRSQKIQAFIEKASGATQTIQLWMIRKLPDNREWGDVIDQRVKPVLGRTLVTAERDILRGKIDAEKATTSEDIDRIFDNYIQDLLDHSIKMRLGSSKDPAHLYVTFDTAHWVAWIPEGQSHTNNIHFFLWDVDLREQPRVMIIFGKQRFMDARRPDAAVVIEGANKHGIEVIEQAVLDPVIFHDVSRDSILFDLEEGQRKIMDLSSNAGILGLAPLADTSDSEEPLIPLKYYVLEKPVVSNVAVAAPTQPSQDVVSTPEVAPAATMGSLAGDTYLAGAIYYLYPKADFKEWKNNGERALSIEKGLREFLHFPRNAPLVGIEFENALDKAKTRNGKNLKRKIENRFASWWEDSLVDRPDFLSMHRPLDNKKDEAIRVRNLPWIRSRYITTALPSVLGGLSLLLRHDGPMVIGVAAVTVVLSLLGYWRGRRLVHNFLNWLYPNSVLTLSSAQFADTFTDNLLKAADYDPEGARQLARGVTRLSRTIIEDYQLLFDEKTAIATWNKIAAPSRTIAENDYIGHSVAARVKAIHPGSYAEMYPEFQGLPLTKVAPLVTAFLKQTMAFSPNVPKGRPTEMLRMLAERAEEVQPLMPQYKRDAAVDADPEPPLTDAVNTLHQQNLHTLTPKQDVLYSKTAKTLVETLKAKYGDRSKRAITLYREAANEVVHRLLILGDPRKTTLTVEEDANLVMPVNAYISEVHLDKDGTYTAMAKNFGIPFDKDVLSDFVWKMVNPHTDELAGTAIASTTRGTTRSLILAHARNAEQNLNKVSKAITRLDPPSDEDNRLRVAGHFKFLIRQDPRNAHAGDTPPFLVNMMLKRINGLTADEVAEEFAEAQLVYQNENETGDAPQGDQWKQWLADLDRLNAKSNSDTLAGRAKSAAKAEKAARIAFEEKRRLEEKEAQREKILREDREQSSLLLYFQHALDDRGKGFADSYPRASKLAQEHYLAYQKFLLTQEALMDEEGASEKFVSAILDEEPKPLNNPPSAIVSPAVSEEAAATAVTALENAILSQIVGRSPTHDDRDFAAEDARLWVGKENKTTRKFRKGPFTLFLERSAEAQWPYSPTTLQGKADQFVRMFRSLQPAIAQDELLANKVDSINLPRLAYEVLRQEAEHEGSDETNLRMAVVIVTLQPPLNSVKENLASAHFFEGDKAPEVDARIGLAKALLDRLEENPDQSRPIAQVAESFATAAGTIMMNLLNQLRDISQKNGGRIPALEAAREAQNEIYHPEIDNPLLQLYVTEHYLPRISVEQLVTAFAKENSGPKKIAPQRPNRVASSQDQLNNALASVMFLRYSDVNRADLLPLARKLVPWFARYDETSVAQHWPGTPVEPREMALQFLSLYDEINKELITRYPDPAVRAKIESERLIVGALSSMDEQNLKLSVAAQRAVDIAPQMFNLTLSPVDPVIAKKEAYRASVVDFMAKQLKSQFPVLSESKAKAEAGKRVDQFIREEDNVPDYNLNNIVIQWTLRNVKKAPNGANWFSGYFGRLDWVYGVLFAWITESGSLELAQHLQPVVGLSPLMATLGFTLLFFALHPILNFFSPELRQLPLGLRFKTAIKNSLRREVGIMTLATFAASMLVFDPTMVHAALRPVIIQALALMHLAINGWIYRHQMKDHLLNSLPQLAGYLNSPATTAEAFASTHQIPPLLRGRPSYKQAVSAIFSQA